MSSPVKTLTQEVDDLAITILKMATARQVEGDASPSRGAGSVAGAAASPAHHTAVQQQSVNVSAVTADTDGGRSPIHLLQSHRATPLSPRRSFKGAADASRHERLQPDSVDGQIAAILLAPHAANDRGVSPARPSAAAATTIPTPSAGHREGLVPSPFGAAHQAAYSYHHTSPQRLPTYVSHSPASHNNREVGYEVTMQTIANNMSRLVHSAAVLEAESKQAALDRRWQLKAGGNHTATSTDSGGRLHNSTATTDVQSPLSQTLPPPLSSPHTQQHQHEQLFTLTLQPSTSGSPIAMETLQQRVHEGKEQTKLLVHELHLLELRMKRELSEKDRQHAMDRDTWAGARTELVEENRRLQSRIDILLEEQHEAQRRLQAEAVAKQSLEETLRLVSNRMQDLELAHDKEIASWKAQYNTLQQQLTRLRQRRDDAERKLIQQGHTFASVAEHVTHSDAKIQVLQSHIHKLHVREQQKDEQLHDVAVFVKHSLAPFIHELDNTGFPPECRKCLKHHHVVGCSAGKGK